MHISEYENFVKFTANIRLFSMLKEQELSDIASRFLVRNFINGEVVMSEDSSVENTFSIIYTGTVNIVTNRSDGEDQIHQTLNSGEFLGEMALLEGKPRSASVIAKGDCMLYTLKKVDFFWLLEYYPVVSIELLGILSSRLREANKRLADYSFNRSYNKVRKYILSLISSQGIRLDNGSIEIADLPKQNEIASIVGCSRETVSRQFSRLINEKVIVKKSRKKLEVLNAEALL